MEENESERPLRPMFSTPGMKLWLLIALNFGCYGILFLFMRFDAFSWLTASPETSTPTIAKLSQGFATLFIFLVPVLVFANAALPERFDYYKLHRRVRIAPLILAVVAILVSVFFIDIVSRWNSSLITDPGLIAGNEESGKLSDWVFQMPHLLDLILCLLVSAVAPAVAEELFFRGGIQQLFLEWTRKPHVAIIATAFLFSFLHVDPFNFVSRFVLGIALGYMFWWSGSLRLSIAAHFAFNAFGIVNVYLIEHYPESWWAKAETTYVMGVISLVVSLGALFTCRNLLKRNPVA